MMEAALSFKRSAEIQKCETSQEGVSDEFCARHDLLRNTLPLVQPPQVTFMDILCLASLVVVQHLSIYSTAIVEYDN
jgi:hypothetical protein